MEEKPKKEKNEVVSIRIDTKVLDKIRSIASNKKTSLNSLINQLLRHSVEWDILASKTGWIPITKFALVSMLDNLDEKAILEIGERVGKIVTKDLLLTMSGKYDVLDWISVLRNRADAAGFGYSEIEEDGQIKCIMHHDMGLKWSKYFKSFYDSAFKELGYDLKFNLSENTLVYRLVKKNIAAI